MSQKCSDLGIPKSLHSNGRIVDMHFSNEMLYRRFKASKEMADWNQDNTLSSSIFPVKNDSCNREKYSDLPSDVLYNIREEDKGAHYFETYGVLGINSEHVASFKDAILLVNGVVRKFKLQVIHSPEECMYPHCEIIVLENEEKIDDKKPKSIKALIRTHLIKHATIVEK